MLIRQGEKIVFFGDSLTQRTDLNESEHPARRYSLDYAGSYVDILVKRLLIHFPQLEFTFYNRGVGGDTIRHLLERYSHDVAPLHPTMMILWIGQNDAKALDPAHFEQGLRCLLDACGDPGTLRANTLSYKLSPMLNAPGRLYDSGGSSVLKALLCKDQELGNSYVTKMVAINQDRKRMVEAYLSLACDSAQGQSSPIVVYLPGLLEGLLGVVAGRLLGTFNSTVVVLSDSRDGKAIKGSVRAVPGDNAKELLDSVRNLLTVYGGHSGAAGMTLERANLDAFTDALKEMRSSLSVCSNLLYDVELSQETVFRSMRALNRFEPLGHGVPNPVCVIRNVEVQDVAYMGQDKNTVKLVCDGFSILGFGKAELYRKHNEPRTLDVIGTLSENHFRGRTTIQVVAEDFHPCIF